MPELPAFSLYIGIVMFSDSEKTMMESVSQALFQPQPTNERMNLEKKKRESPSVTTDEEGSSQG